MALVIINVSNSSLRSKRICSLVSQSVYFNFSIAKLKSLLLEVVAMFFCAPCRPEFYVLASRSTDHRVISCEGEAYDV